MRIADAPQKHHLNLIKKCYCTEPGVSWLLRRLRKIPLFYLIFIY